MSDAFLARWDEFRRMPNHPEMSVFPDRQPRALTDATRDALGELTCPRCRYSLRGISGVYCPECGLHLEYEPVTVFTAADQSLVWAAALVMDRHEISNLIVTGSFDPFLGMFARASSMPRLMVPHKFYREGVEVLEREFGKRLFKRGETPPRPPASPRWECPGCGEKVPGSFDICWSCSSQRPSAQ